MRLQEKATKENTKELRIKAMQEIDAKPIETLQDEMVKRMYDWWGSWVPDYEGWLKIADGLYAPNAIIHAIGGEQKYCDYRLSMSDLNEKQRTQADAIYWATKRLTGLVSNILENLAEKPPVFICRATIHTAIGSNTS